MAHRFHEPDTMSLFVKLPGGKAEKEVKSQKPQVKSNENQCFMIAKLSAIKLQSDKVIPKNA